MSSQDFKKLNGQDDASSKNIIYMEEKNHNQESQKETLHEPGPESLLNISQSNDILDEEANHLSGEIHLVQDVMQTPPRRAAQTLTSKNHQRETMSKEIYTEEATPKATSTDSPYLAKVLQPASANSPLALQTSFSIGYRQDKKW